MREIKVFLSGILKRFKYSTHRYFFTPKFFDTLFLFLQDLPLWSNAAVKNFARLDFFGRAKFL